MMKRRRSRLLLLSILLAGPALVSCGEGAPTDPPTPQPAALRAVSGPDTLAMAGEASLVVEVRDEAGVGLEGVAVQWSASTGTLAATRTSTGFDGRASTTWSAAVAGTHRVTATVAGLTPVDFELSVLAHSLACEDLGVATEAAEPLESLAVTGLPAGLGDPIVVEVVADGDTAYTFVERDGSTGTLTAPLHPAGDPGGGPVELHFTGGGERCPGLGFTVEALPAADGQLESVVDSLQALVDLQAGYFGVTGAELRQARVDTMPEYLWPLMVAQSVIEHPDNPNSLVAVLEGTAPMLEEYELNRGMVNALLARTDAVAMLGEQLAHMRSTAPTATSSPARLAALSPGSCGSVSTAEALAYCMQAARSAQGARDGLLGEALGDLGLVVGLAGFIPGLGTASFVVGGVMWAADKVLEGMSKLLPSEFADMDYTLGQASFMEDEDGSSSWEDAWVTATTRGWQMDQEILEALLQIAGAKAEYDSFLKAGLPASALDDLQGVLHFIETTIAGEVISQSGGTGGLASIPARVTPRIDVSADQYSQSTVYGEPAIRMLDHFTYEPVGVGVAELRVEAEATQFGGAYIAVGKDVEVEAIRVIMEPDFQVVEPGDRVELTARVEGSSYPDQVEFTADAGSVTASFDGERTHTLTVETPVSGEAFPYLVTARSTSTGGARGHAGAPPRVGTATIDTELSVRIDPAGTCVPFGESRTFTATVHGTADQQVDWEVSGGSIDSGGTFTAPGTQGQVTVTARSVADPDVQGQAPVWVAEDCSCWWTVTVSGDYTQTMAGDSATSFRQINEDGTLGSWMYASLGNQNSIHHVGVLDVAPLIPVGETGTFSGEVWGTVFPTSDLQVQWGAQEDSERGGETLQVLSHTERRIRMNAWGAMRGRYTVESENSEDIFVRVDVAFQADLSPLMLSLIGEDPESYCKAP